MDTNKLIETPNDVEAAFLELRPRVGNKDRELSKRFRAFLSEATRQLFGEPPADRPCAFTEWSPIQQAFLIEVAQTPMMSIVNSGSLGRLLTNVGAMTIGGDRDDLYLKRYCGLCEPTALERQVQGRPVWLWLRLRLMGEVSAEDLGPVVALLSDDERLDVARRALDNAYHLTRRFPLPFDVTIDVERVDVAATVDALSPVVAAASEATLLDWLATEEREDVALLFALAILDRGVALPKTSNAILASALSYRTLELPASKVLAALEESRQLALVASLSLKWFNLDGWTHLTAINPAAAGKVLVANLRRFDTECRPNVSAQVAELLLHVDEPSRAAIAKLANGDGPNAAMLRAALCTVN